MSDTRGPVAASVLGALLLLAPSALANPVDAFGFGARPTAMGSAGTATADGVAANYYNPAALAAIDDIRLELGYAHLVPELRIDGGDLGLDAHRGFQGGAVIGGDVFGHRVAFSFGLFLPDRMITRIRALPEQQPRFVLYDNRPQRLVLAASLAVEVWDDVYVGAGLTFLSHTRGVLKVSGEVDFFDPEKTVLTSAVREDLVAVRYPSAGVLWTPENWRIGVSYRDEFVLELDLDVIVEGDIVVDGDPFIEDASFVLNSLNYNLFSPRQVSLGVAYEGPCWLLTADLTWAQWSRFPSPTASVEITLDIPDADFAIPPPDAPLPPDFHDIFIPRVGGEWTVYDTQPIALTMRGGYFYEPSPAPAQRGKTNYVDTDKHGLSAGLGIRLGILDFILPKPLELDFTAQVIVMPSRRYEKSSAADPVGEYVADGLWYGGSFTSKFLF